MKRVCFLFFFLFLPSQLLFGDGETFTLTWNDGSAIAGYAVLGYGCSQDVSSTLGLQAIPEYLKIPGQAGSFSFTTPVPCGGTYCYTVSSGGSVLRSGSFTTSDPCNNRLTPGAVTIDLSASASLQFTNYTMTLQNIAAAPAEAVWTFNGSVAKSEVLQPGQSDTYTTPPIEVAPAPQNFTLYGTVKPLQTSVNYADNGGGSPVITFGNTGSASSSAGGSGGTITNSDGGGAPVLTVTASNSPVSAPTNLVTFAPSTGNSAQEPTLQAGFQLLHADNLNTLNGLNVLNNSINGVMAITNAQGQEVALLYSNQYYDGVWLPKIYAAITNEGQFPTNLTVSVPTNPASSSSNVSVQNWPQAYSNYLGQIASNTAALNSFTNSGSNYLGNFNLASNQMTGLIPSAATNASAAIAAATAAEGDYGITAFLAALSPSIPADASSIPSMQMNFCGRTLDFNPVTMFPNVAVISYLGLKIVAELMFLIDVGRMFWELVRAKASTSTGGVPDLEIFGGAEALTFGGEFGGNFIGAIVAIFIPVAFILIWSVAMAYLFSNLGFSISEAMNISNWAGQFPALAWALLTTFIPVNTLFTLLCTRITLQFTLGKIVSIAANASRFLWGK